MEVRALQLKQERYLLHSITSELIALIKNPSSSSCSPSSSSSSPTIAAINTANNSNNETATSTITSTSSSSSPTSFFSPETERLFSKMIQLQHDAIQQHLHHERETKGARFWMDTVK